MFSLFKKKETPEELQALALYDEIVIAARQPEFYADLSVPDDVDGRFDMISLHASLLIVRLEQIGSDEAIELSQIVFDKMFLDMDRSLREMGISDLAVPKHMKRMLQGFNGRAQAYKAALLEDSSDALKSALTRNVYGTLEEVDPKHIGSMSNYVMSQWAHLSGRSLQDFQNIENIFIRGDVKSES